MSGVPAAVTVLVTVLMTRDAVNAAKLIAEVVDLLHGLSSFSPQLVLDVTVGDELLIQATSISI